MQWTRLNKDKELKFVKYSQHGYEQSIEEMLVLIYWSSWNDRKQITSIYRIFQIEQAC